MTVLQKVKQSLFFAVCSMDKYSEKWEEVMVLKLFHLVLKNYGKMVIENVWEPCLLKYS